MLRAGTERQRRLVALEEYLADHGPADHALIHCEQLLAFVEAIETLLQRRGS